MIDINNVPDILTEENTNKMTEADLAELEAIYQKRSKSHKKFCLGFLATAGILLGLAAVTIFPWGLAAFGPAWWSVNGSLMGLGFIGLGAAGITRTLDRKNRKNIQTISLKLKQIAAKNQTKPLSEREQVELAEKVDKSAKKNERALDPKVKQISQKRIPEIDEMSR